MNFCIVDDISEQRKRVRNIILKSMMDNKLEFNIKEFQSFSEDLKEYIKNDINNTIYILDLELGNDDGIDIARYIRNEENNWKSPIIIATAHTNMYYEVYKQRLQILDFVSKDENEETNMEEAINVCLRMLVTDKSYRFVYKNIDYSINLSQIDYIQRDGRKIKIVTKSQEYFQNRSINEIKKDLPSNFIVSSKGILINMNNIDTLNWNNLEVIFKSGLKGYLISKSHKKEIECYDN